MTAALFSPDELPDAAPRSPRPRARRRLRRTPIPARRVREVLDHAIRSVQRGRDPLGPKSWAELKLQAVRALLIGAELAPHRSNARLFEDPR